MRVLVDARIGWGSGIGRVISESVPRVAARRPAWRFDLLVNARDRDRAEQVAGRADNVAVRLTDIDPFTMGEQLRLPALARDYDLTWFTNYWVPLRYPGPFVVTVHDVLHLRAHLFPASPLKRASSRATFHKVRRGARAVMFDSAFTAREFIKEIGEPRQASVVRLGADHVAAVAPALFASKERRVLVVAAAKVHKNFRVVLDAWCRAAIGSEWRLTVVSPADPLRTSVDLARDVAAHDRVDLVQGISDGELAALYARSSILLLPSRYEGFGLPLLEGMRAGTWCISSTAGALVEIANGGFAGFVDAEDGAGWSHAIERACDTFDRDRGLFLPLLRHNLEHANRFAWDRTADRIADVLGGHSTP